MRNGEVIHPGADIELLSRWHDGELSAGERAHFEAHRAHCGACRRAAEEYVTAMTFFRGSRSSGRPPRDLSARILRRIQPTGSRRPPVGIVHGIDLRWAAAIILAIVAGLLGRAGVPQPEDLAMPIRLVTPPVEIAAPAEPPAAALASAQIAETSREEIEPPVAAAAAVVPPPRRPAARPVYPEPDTISAAPLPAPRRVRAAAPPPPAIASGPPVRRSAERFGGEGAGGEMPAFTDPVTSPDPLEVRITSADAAGWPPQVRNAEEIRLPAEQRGLRYIVMIDAQGIVRAVETIVPSSNRGSRVLGVVPPAEIWKIRFQGDGRPRRLLIKID